MSFLGMYNYLYQKFITLLKYILEDKIHMNVYQFLVGLDIRIKIFVNLSNPKTLDEAYDLAKKEEGNLGIKWSFFQLQSF